MQQNIEAEFGGVITIDSNQSQKILHSVFHLNNKMCTCVKASVKIIILITQLQTV